MSDYYDNNENRCCSICHRSEKEAGRLIDMPGGLKLCPDCMQKMINTAQSIDPNDIWNQMQNGNFDMFSFMNKMNDSMNNAGSVRDKNSAPESSEKLPEAESVDSDSAAVVESSENGNASSENDNDLSDDSTEEKKDKNSENGRHSTVSFLNLSDLLGGGFQRQPKVKKKKKDGPKPVFTSDNIPAPHLLKAELDKYVIGQDEAKKMISVAAYNHYKRVKTGTMEDIEIEKSNILLIGPTGCGKTYLVRTLARLLDVPLAITDATNLTEAGYIGDDVESCISKLLAEADNDVDKAEKGIVFIDEIDKLAKKQNTNSRDVSGEAVQQGLLKLLEGSEVEVPIGANSKNAMVPMTTVDTTNILFICGGAFPALEDIIKQRLENKTSIGFSAELRDKNDHDETVLKKVNNDDLRKFGMIPEFIGRLPITCTLDSLNEDMLVNILTEPKNAIIKQYRKLLALDDVDLEFEDDALRAIAGKALERDTGARALRSILEEYMMDIMYEIPKDRNIGKVTITADYINGKGGPRVEIRSIDTPEIKVPVIEADKTAAIAENE